MQTYLGQRNLRERFSGGSWGQFPFSKRELWEEMDSYLSDVCLNVTAGVSLLFFWQSEHGTHSEDAEWQEGKTLGSRWQCWSGESALYEVLPVDFLLYEIKKKIISILLKPGASEFLCLANESILFQIITRFSIFCCTYSQSTNTQSKSPVILRSVKYLDVRKGSVFSKGLEANFPEYPSNLLHSSSFSSYLPLLSFCSLKGWRVFIVKK